MTIKTGILTDVQVLKFLIATHVYYFNLEVLWAQLDFCMATPGFLLGI
jgi:hypothetical protein